jgi:capsular exopolysaccharide synthesis family protein
LPPTTDELITIADPRSPISEAYRTLRTNIQFSGLDRSLRTIVITSTAADEGKSTTLANLAVAFAQGGRKTIAVDTDLRRPSLHKIFGLSNERGLTSIALDETPDLVLQTTIVPNLRILSSGPLPPNPSELLSSQRMERIIEALKTEAEFILFDSPPIIAVSDAAVLARRLDGVLLLVSAGKTKRDQAVKAKTQLEKVGANIIGVVLNNVKVDKNLYYYSQ